ncbi:MAG TPA: hypothetical protein PLM63_04100 [bacterium]|nr:hypothetical protein [bacterium]
MKRKIHFFFVFLGIVFPIASFLIFAKIDYAKIWNTWGLQTDGTVVYPDILNYFMLIIFKCSLYFFPPLIISFGMIIENRKNIVEHKKIFYIINSFSYWFLGLLIIKILADNIFEIDAVFNFTFFNSIKEIQALVGYIVSVILKRNFKVEEGFNDQKELEKKLNF